MELFVFRESHGLHQVRFGHMEEKQQHSVKQNVMQIIMDKEEM